MFLKFLFIGVLVLVLKVVYVSLVEDKFKFIVCKNFVSKIDIKIIFFIYYFLMWFY